jgi:hypothetical protein
LSPSTSKSNSEPPGRHHGNTDTLSHLKLGIRYLGFQGIEIRQLNRNSSVAGSIKIEVRSELITLGRAAPNHFPLAVASFGGYPAMGIVSPDKASNLVRVPVVVTRVSGTITVGATRWQNAEPEIFTRSCMGRISRVRSYGVER